MSEGKYVYKGGNRPYAGARTKKELPRGDKPIQLYSLGTPNGQKVSIALEEMKLPYDAHNINIMQGDQFTSGFTEINPNAKIPALVDTEGPGGKEINVFESGSILQYLAEKSGQFLPPQGTAERVQTLNWLNWQMGGYGPMAGQFNHFFMFNNDNITYAIERYGMEVKRLLDVLDKQLEGKEFIIGDEYTIADMAIFPWVNVLDHERFAKGKEYLFNEAFNRKDSYSNVMSWVKRVGKRDAVTKGLLVNSYTDPSAIGEDKGEKIPSTDPNEQEDGATARS